VDNDMLWRFSHYAALASILFVAACETAPPPPVATPVAPSAPAPQVEARQEEKQVAVVGKVPFDAWLIDFRKEARGKGIREATLNSAFADVKLIPRVVELDRAQPEFKLTFKQYMEKVAPQGRIDKGRARLKEYDSLLAPIAKEYGVPARFITALWAVETDFGRVTGSFPVVSSLTTLAYDGRRSSFFRGELINALKIIDQGHITAEKMKGSWAGAMGQNQFMPSSFLSFAVDRDGDGRRDIWTSTPDVFASIANYLSKSGWNPNQNWGREVRLPAGFDGGLASMDIRKPLTEWKNLGVRAADGSPLPDQSITASLVATEGVGGSAFLVYENYRVIMKWNRSHNFALAVGYLADRFVAK
jgi:membrane-bound lytic murein transglycosylase B